eukprot:gene28324-31550_t
MAHLGVGAFHRCHQAEFTDDMLERSGGDWAVVGINLRPPLLAESLGAQGGLYLRSLRNGDDPPDRRIIGSIREVVDAQASSAPAIARLADPRIHVVTLTITEKGYCHVPATGALQAAHPDILHDLENPDTPRSVPGVLVAALDRRRLAGSGGLTLISCDNIPSNGTVLAAVIAALAEARSRELAGWIAVNVTFPSTMVDRIVPATTDDDLADAGRVLGLDDRAAVVGEPFRQWVIEDRFAGPRPPWDVAGAQFVTDVAAYEIVKMRVLNGAQSTLAFLGALCGLETTCDDIRHPDLAQFVRRMLIDETVPYLPNAPGMEPLAYVAQSLDRIDNASIRHRNHQIATDGSQKIVQRLVNPLRDCLKSGAPHDRLACAIAAFIAYLAAASPRFGARWQPADPFA